ncbi:hypothetical protein N7481_007267 [Penicillium waksmanii]|uniref:uncharacterized protein n=1 Tax=Penicillium waksmanii TaxID=69791 RepID=UPI002549AB19|nr:uncharacterized protein N7481_007267 [Penicillium waksmanii]KAJ5979969.1 hypothetical protein N7481_007267 [Penicillium waksmanii]
MAQNQHSGAPPSYEDSQMASSSASASAPVQPPPYHNWQEAVPDTTVFPPPPISGYYSSGTGNASASDADRAHQFCDSTPLWTPVLPSSTVWNEVHTHDIRPVQPREFNGKLTTTSRGHWKGSSTDRNGDCVVLTHLPLYFAAVDSPFAQSRKKTIYFELKLKGLRAGPGSGGDDASGFTMGFAAGPYPSWRSPGWERGSLGVCSDDGCRFVNDSWGGRDFTTPVQIGETVGLGMVFDIPDRPILGTGTGDSDSDSKKSKRCKVEVFFTRNGRPAGGWNLHEEIDEDSGGVNGLEGDFDLYGAIGLFGGVDFESCFDPAGWLWKPT